ncbi:MAG TPA: hypothetical protein VIN57_05805 [Magnetovibrio sp.]
MLKLLKPLIYAAIVAVFVIQTANVPSVNAKPQSSHVASINQH